MQDVAAPPGHGSRNRPALPTTDLHPPIAVRTFALEVPFMQFGADPSLAGVAPRDTEGTGTSARQSLSKNTPYSLEDAETGGDGGSPTGRLTKGGTLKIAVILETMGYLPDAEEECARREGRGGGMEPGHDHRSPWDGPGAAKNVAWVTGVGGKRVPFMVPPKEHEEEEDMDNTASRMEQKREEGSPGQSREPTHTESGEEEGGGGEDDYSEDFSEAGSRDGSDNGGEEGGKGFTKEVIRTRTVERKEESDDSTLHHPTISAALARQLEDHQRKLDKALADIQTTAAAEAEQALDKWKRAEVRKMPPLTIAGAGFILVLLDCAGAKVYGGIG